jgi:CubicO group peptidase (beta-lactamase class C family)
MRFLNVLPLLAPALLQAQQPPATPATTTSAAIPRDRATVIAIIDSLANDHLGRGVPSVAVAVVRGRDTIVMRGYGLANREASRAATPNTIYEIGSITKQFTAAAIMRLVEQGKIGLQDDMSKYLPDFPLQGHHVTIRQLLNHTSGIHSYTSSPAWRATWARDLPPDSIVAFVARDSFDFAPGTKWAYNNTGYVLLGMIIEKVAGKPYATVLDEMFFHLLGLTQTGYCPSRTSDARYAAGYSVRGPGAPAVPAEYLSLTHPFSAGALCSTVRDYLAWQRALHGGRVVSAASYKEMTTPDTLPNGGRHNYGFGLAVGMLGTHRMIQHGGGINGFTTAQSWFPDDSLSVIVFTNADGIGPDMPAMNMARAVLGLPLVSRPVAPPVVPIDAAGRARVAGTYDFRMPPGGTFTVHLTVDGDQLMGQPEGPGQGKFPMLHYGNDVFGAAFDPTLRFTVISANGVVTGATLAQRGGVMQGVRRP